MNDVQVEYIRELKVARQELAPNTRLEVDGYIRSGLPLPTSLAKVVIRALATVKEKQNA